MFFELIAKPRAHEVVQRPQHFYRKSGLTAVLRLTSHSHAYNENINQDFIANSFLYLALRSGSCKVSIVKELLRLDCPMLNPALAPDQHDFHPLFTLLKRSFNSPYGPWWMHRRQVSRFFLREEAATLKELGSALLAKQLPAFDHEVAIGVDVSLDSSQHTKNSPHRDMDHMTWSRTHPDLLRLVLSTGRLFGSIYSFHQDQINFWTTKTLQLLFHQTMLGLTNELLQTTTQLNAFLPAVQVPLKVSEIQAEKVFNVTGLATSNALVEGKFLLRGSKSEILHHVEALRTLLLTTCFLRLEETPTLPWFEKAFRQVCCGPEMFLQGSDRQPLAALKQFFHAFRAFQRHKCTTLLHYLAKYPELLPDLTAALQGLARSYAHTLDSQGRSPLTKAARAANPKAVELLLQVGAPVSPDALFLALQGSKQGLTLPLSADEEGKRLQIFECLFAKLNPHEREAVLSGDQGQGPAESLGYPLILACARYSEAGVKQLLALGLSPCLVHIQKVPKKVRQGGRINTSSQLIPTCALKEALKRKHHAIALLVFQDIMSKHPLTFAQQRYFSYSSLYGECTVLAKRLDLQEIAEGFSLK